MKTKQDLYISIPDPCNQDWGSMQKAGDGKYCTRCSNIVYDLSGLNDNELVVFFKMNPAIHCGRFHNSQLNRNILPPKKKQLFSFERFRKIAATFFAIL